MEKEKRNEAKSVVLETMSPNSFGHYHSTTGSLKKRCERDGDDEAYLFSFSSK